MAQRTDIDSLGAPKRGRPYRYPWNEWFDGGVWELDAPADFDCSRDQFRSRANSAAKNQGGRVVTRAVAGSRTKLRIQFLPGRPGEETAE